MKKQGNDELILLMRYLGIYVGVFVLTILFILLGGLRLFGF